MSRHSAPARGPRGGKRHIVAGWDRPLQQLFVNVYRGDRVDPGAAMHSLTMSSIESVDTALAEMRLTVPKNFVAELRSDCETNAGNRIVEHNFDEPLKVIHAG